MQKFAGPFIAYQSEIRGALVDRNAYVSVEWFQSQMPRVAKAYDLGEPVWMIADTLAFFAQGVAASRTKSPRALAQRVVRVT